MVNNWRDLIRPRQIEVEEGLSESYGKFECAPLERGFGLTLGNALRRILLSSLQGAAISSIRIENVLHEFTSIPGTLEDVTDIILNLKEVRLRMHSQGPKTITAEKSGPGVVCAEDFTSGDQTVEILNGKHHIATLSEDAEFHLSATVEMGRGFVLAEKNKREDQPVGTLPIDSIFSPIRRVNYTVTNARVGRETDYDKLVMEIWTDGSVAPVDALAYAAKILKEQLAIFINFEDDVEVTAGDRIRAAELNEVLFRPVEELEVSVRSANCLQNADIKYIGELVQRTDQEMLKTKNFGRKSLNEIQKILTDMGLEFGMRLDNFPTRQDLDRARGVES
ncbi:MAG: DNA-directed RNA polymerase subunit alpha [Planctomycetes bacterium]|nr:DNA-directed RNA polymerase subunit alpha [Planctomycetota bacterium]